ncbi:hypothetical protein KEM56_007863 [Ascosphaera pollenicola]|nr:hypothetical protein KEM56_007863 [Ascosphaera pollenicola]
MAPHHPSEAKLPCPVCDVLVTKKGLPAPQQSTLCKTLKADLASGKKLRCQFRQRPYQKEDKEVSHWATKRCQKIREGNCTGKITQEDMNALEGGDLLSDSVIVFYLEYPYSHLNISLGEKTWMFFDP